jgi:hypothetical protein
MPFPVIWTLNYELQFDFKKRENLGNYAIFLNFDFIAPLLTKANRGVHPPVDPPLN